MIRRRRRIWDAEAQHEACTGAQVILPPACSHLGAGETGHEVIELSDAPGKILGNNHVHAAASGNRKRVLVRCAHEFRAAAGAADKEFGERNEVIKLPQVQPRTKKVGDKTTGHTRVAPGDREQVSVKPIASKFPCESQPS